MVVNCYKVSRVIWRRRMSVRTCLEIELIVAIGAEPIVKLPVAAHIYVISLFFIWARCTVFV